MINVASQIYLISKGRTYIEDCLTAEVKNISKYLEDSELVINLKKGKTESMLLGTAKRLSSVQKPFEVHYRESVIHQTLQYKYLGNTVAPSLNLNENFMKKYKKASGRLRLLTKVRPFMTQKSAIYVYTMMIAPLLKDLLLLLLWKGFSFYVVFVQYIG